MKLSVFLGLILIGLGLYGSLYVASFFFGFVTVGIFVLIYSSTQKRAKPLNVAEQRITHPFQQSVQPMVSFCPRCGTEIRQGITNCPQCGEKVI